ncbi:MAG: hypothetical protein SNJ77_04490 [Cytophagales bacterium]
MRSKFIIFVLSFLALNCFSQNRKAALYNNKMFAEQEKVSLAIINFFKDFQNADYNSLEKQHQNILTQIDKSYKVVASMPDFENDNSLRDAALKWFSGYKESFENEYKLMLPLLGKKEKTQEDKAKLEEMHQELIKEEEELDKNLLKIQTEFAKKHNLTLEETK